MSGHPLRYVSEVSEAAILVISKAIPINPLANERKLLHSHRTPSILNENEKEAERKSTIDNWEKRGTTLQREGAQQDLFQNLRRD